LRDSAVAWTRPRDWRKPTTYRTTFFFIPHV
jgi:hypothetical protein